MLNEGRHQGKPVLKADTVKLMTAPRQVPSGKGQSYRTYGWEMSSSPRGTIFPHGVSYGHTGFTGTSIWLDPRSGAAVIILSNRVHPDGKGDASKLRSRVATIAGKVLAPE
jgi:CubicO group peptidase (beta-lactamase class C family)